MDIGDPSNFARILELHNKEHAKVKDTLIGYAYSDDETRAAMKDISDRTGYLCEPHGAIAYLALKAYQKDNDCQGIILETAHPAKFHDVVEPVIGKKVEIPERLKEYLTREKKADLMDNTFASFKSYLLKRVPA
tara:strand:- start:399 stop:800 length:402 start_codon:yes stop_codon:yes gene_type:complete